MTITEAWVTAPGDPSVGLPDHQMILNHLDLDLNVYEAEERCAIVKELRTRLQEIGSLVTGEAASDVQVYLEGYDNQPTEE